MVFSPRSKKKFRGQKKNIGDVKNEQSCSGSPLRPASLLPQVKRRQRNGDARGGSKRCRAGALRRTASHLAEPEEGAALERAGSDSCGIAYDSEVSWRPVFPRRQRRGH